MNFTELLNAVYSITARPDLVDLTKLAVKAATLKAHKTDFYTKDIYETSLQFTTLDYVHSLDYISQIPNYRALKYIRKYDQSTGKAGDFFTALTTEEILDEFGRERTDICYVAGRVIEMKSSTEFDTVFLGCYVLPVVTESNFASWIADLYPFAIVHEAARFVFASIGQQDQKNAQKEFVAEQYSELKINAVTDVGY